MDDSSTATGVAAPAIPRVGLLSRRTIRAAIARVQQVHGLTDPDDGFGALQKASQAHNVKLRAVAAAFLSEREPAANGSRPRPAAPALTFSTHGADAQPNRKRILTDLMTGVSAAAGADFGIVQLRDPVHGGLIIENQHGFDRDFLDLFAYLDDTGTASGTTLARRSATAVADVATSPIYGATDRAAILAAGVRALLSVPLLDEHGDLQGAVAAIFAAPHEVPEATETTIRRHADECARWLHWYDLVTMPRVVASVHAAARAARAAQRGTGGASPTPIALPPRISAIQ